MQSGRGHRGAIRNRLLMGQLALEQLVELLPRHFDPNIRVNGACGLDLQDAVEQRNREILAGIGEVVAQGDVLP